jgi:hypothetical protein
MQLSSYRRILTIEVRRWIALAEKWPQDNWLDLWHAHVDWKSRARLSSAHRDAELSALFRLHASIAEITANLSRPFHLWVYVDQADPGLDAVYVHTPNPNPKAEFPLKVDVDWQALVPSWLSAHVLETERVGKAQRPDRGVAWFVERTVGPNQRLQSIGDASE